MATAAKSLQKNNAKALRLRQEGNQRFRERQFDDALTKYTESLCWAESDSEHLGIAYGNLSAVFYDQVEFEFALAYIALAKRHNYPERLMPKLETRERNCLLLKGSKFQRDNEEGLSDLFCKLTLNVELNPRIPFIAKGMHVEDGPKWGTVMVADRDFKVGDVILEESSVLGCLHPTHQYQYCHYCFGDLMDGAVPCPECVSTVYCNEQCLEKCWQAFHRFECGIAQELQETGLKVGYAFTGLRMFLYGLSLFKDDVDKMIEFRKANPRLGSDPMKLDLVNHDPLEAFKTISTAKNCPSCAVPTKEKAIEFYKVYRKNPLIQSLFNDKAKQSFMLQSFLDYLQALPWCYIDTTASEYYTIASSFDSKPYDGANVTRLGIHGYCKMVVHRPVKKGDQLTLQQNVDPAVYDCKCNSLLCMNTDPPGRGFAVLLKVVRDPNVDDLAKANAYQQFIQKFSHLFERCFFRRLVKAYHKLLEETFVHQSRVKMRVKAMCAFSSSQQRLAQR